MCIFSRGGFRRSEAPELELYVMIFKNFHSSIIAAIASIYGAAGGGPRYTSVCTPDSCSEEQGVYNQKPFSKYCAEDVPKNFG